MKQKLQSYYDGAKQKSVYFNATLLDPSLKNLHFRSDKNEYKTIKKNFEDALKPFEKSSEVATQVETESECWTEAIYKKRKVR